MFDFAGPGFEEAGIAKLRCKTGVSMAAGLTGRKRQAIVAPGYPRGVEVSETEVLDGKKRERGERKAPS